MNILKLVQEKAKSEAWSSLYNNTEASEFFLGEDKSKQAGQLLLIASQVIECATKLVRVEDYQAVDEPI
jgi:hypothetical protein